MRDFFHCVWENLLKQIKLSYCSAYLKIGFATLLYKAII